MSTPSDSSPSSDKRRRVQRTQLTRLARLLAAETQGGYQKALQDVTGASNAGVLPERLDHHGLDKALRILMQQDYVMWSPLSAGHPWPGVYNPLTHALPGARSKRALEAAERARSAGVGKPVEDVVLPTYDDEEDYEDDDEEEDGFGNEPERTPDGSGGPEEPDDKVPGPVPGPQQDTEIAERWWLDQLAQDDVLPRYRMPDPYPGRAELPLDAALGTKRATGDVDGYEHELHRIVAAEPRDIDAYAHLGNLALQRHDGDFGDLISWVGPTPAERRRFLKEALAWYEAAVAVGEESLPMAFHGRLPWYELDNRPFLRALQGLALTLWRLGRFNSAERVLVTLLYLNPDDNQGAREILADVRAHRRWHPGITETDDQRIRNDVLIVASRPVRIRPGSLRTLLTGAVPPAPETVSHVVRRAAAEALGATWDGRSPHVVLGHPHTGIKVTVVARHQSGHSLTPDEHWWDAHRVGAEMDGPVLFVLVTDRGCIALAQFLRADELAAYRSADLPRRERTAFTTTFIHGDTRYGTDLSSHLDNILHVLPARPGVWQ
ncbi:tetratricopeptide repeat protein [Streptomyces xiamenensis]|uniref:tetratricopeptide repeat protein n=1 Tax=Streptomyces xiamenensis TaxID=408015 RepID=UPI0035E270D2